MNGRAKALSSRQIVCPLLSQSATLIRDPDNLWSICPVVHWAHWSHQQLTCHSICHWRLSWLRGCSTGWGSHNSFARKKGLEHTRRYGQPSACHVRVLFSCSLLLLTWLISVFPHRIHYPDSEFRLELNQGNEADGTSILLNKLITPSFHQQWRVEPAIWTENGGFC